MRICFQGFTQTGLAAVKKRRELYHAQAAITGLHDVILALVKEEVDVAEIKDFFFHGKTDEEIRNIPYIGGVISFNLADRQSPKR